MKSKAGIICIVLGALFLSGALALALFNMHQDAAARDASKDIMSKLVQHIGDAGGSELSVPQQMLTEEDKKMTEVVIDGHAFVGYLSVPALGLELPVMSSWNYDKLKLSPCRYSGTVRGEDMVIMAHNYKNHFGRLSRLSVDDKLSFTDMDGVTTRYKVVGMDILEPTVVEAMTAGDFDLTLFTCTYGNQSRLTVYCNKEV